MDPRVFFPSGPPPFAHPPSDQSLGIRIKKLAEFAARNGPAFIEEVRTKQSHNPEYAFLHGGEGSTYFFWVLHTELLSQPHLAVAPPPPPSATATLPPQVRSGWAQVLSLLNGSKESITSSQAWFMACAPYASGMAEMLVAAADTAAPAGNYTAALHYLWLVNDILFKANSMRTHSAEVDPIALSFKPHLGHLLRRVYLAAGNDGEKQQAVAKVAYIWSEREVYPSQMVELMVMEMMGVTTNQTNSLLGGHAVPAGQPPPPPPFPPPPQRPALPPPSTQNMMHSRGPVFSGHGPGIMMAAHNTTHHPHQQHHFLPPSAPGQPGWHPPPPPLAPPPPPLPAAEPEEPPFDPFSFPPGLIPRLVEDTLRSEEPYSPLNPSMISNSEVPPPPTMEPDPYLKARLDKYYAQLDAYRIGVDFSDIEGDAALLRSNFPSNDKHGVPLSAGNHRSGSGGVDDGSGGFRAGDGGRGLGYNRGGVNDSGTDGVDTDVFSSYRAMRSQGYHSGIGIRSSKTSRK